MSALGRSGSRSSKLPWTHKIQADKQQLVQQELQRQQFQAEDQERRSALNRDYEQALATYKDLKRELSLLEEQLEDISFGLYKPHFSFQTPEDYKTAIEALRDRERLLIRDNRAAVCPLHWTVGNSQTEGTRMDKTPNSSCAPSTANAKQPAPMSPGTTSRKWKSASKNRRTPSTSSPRSCR
jgi:hypothetical protein